MQPLWQAHSSQCPRGHWCCHPPLAGSILSSLAAVAVGCAVHAFDGYLHDWQVNSFAAVLGLLLLMLLQSIHRSVLAPLATGLLCSFDAIATASKGQGAIEAAIHQAAGGLLCSCVMIAVADASANAHDQRFNLWQAHSYAPFCCVSCCC